VGAANMQPAKKGVYYTEFEPQRARSRCSFYDFSSKKSSIVSA